MVLDVLRKKMQPLSPQNLFQKHACKNLKILPDLLVKTELLLLFFLHRILTVTHRGISVTLEIIVTVQTLTFSYKQLLLAPKTGSWLSALTWLSS